MYFNGFLWIEVCICLGLGGGGGLGAESGDLGFSSWIEAIQGKPGLWGSLVVFCTLKLQQIGLFIYGFVGFFFFCDFQVF